MWWLLHQLLLIVLATIGALWTSFWIAENIDQVIGLVLCIVLLVVVLIRFFALPEEARLREWMKSKR